MKIQSRKPAKKRARPHQSTIVPEMPAPVQPGIQNPEVAEHQAANVDSEAAPICPASEQPIGVPAQPSVSPPPPPVVPWWQFVKESTDAEIKKRFAKEVQIIADSHKTMLASYSALAILSPIDSIDSFEADRIFTALVDTNAKKDKDVMLLLLSSGGSIEPAYQVSTLCKSYSLSRFVSIVPRRAKSAATLIAIGADEIHMGALSQLGPIDPQVGGLPALGVVEAIRRIAELSEEYPGSSEMFAKYLKLALTVEQIGYCERIGKSAVQYATRLLATKPSLKGKEAKIANELVYEYMDHGFVIDLSEAQKHLGDSWIKTDSEELMLAEKVYRLFEDVNLFLGMFHKKRLALIGSLYAEPQIWSR